ncbi:MAG TPA: nuclear transport factor 2 family protein [Pyrinomonadaceae bacterium]|nr:nuclear transport factor 2 family protein [Pyrinomonadaceae bacterium]
MRNQSLLKKMTALALALMFLVTASTTRVEAAPAPDLTPAQIEAAIEDAFAGLVSFDAQRVLNNFAPDAVLEDPVGTPPLQGTQAIAAYLATFPTLFDQMKLYSLDIKVGGQEAGVKWRIRFRTKTGHVFFLEGIGHSSSTSKGRFSQRKSSSIWSIFWSSCRSKRTRLCTKVDSGGQSLWPLRSLRVLCVTSDLNAEDAEHAEKRITFRLFVQGQRTRCL